MTGQAIVIRGDAARLPLDDESVDLIVTSPPYFALRAYRDGDEKYDGQVGSEATPQAFLESLWAVTAEMKRVARPAASIFVNLGDKMAGSGGHNNAELARAKGGGGMYPAGMVEGFLRDAPRGYNRSREFHDLHECPSCGHEWRSRWEVPEQSLMGLPWAYARGCVQRVGLLLRAELVWSKPNHMPESVDDRVARAHEQFFHFTLRSDYYAAIDEIREDHKGVDNAGSSRGPSGQNRGTATGERDETVGNFARDKRGKLPGSVRVVTTEGLNVPQYVLEELGIPKHFAPFPQAWPHWLILGWSPRHVCLECGQGRVPVLHAENEARRARVVGYACPCCPHTDHEGTGERSGRSHAAALDSGQYVSNDFGGRLADRPVVSGWREWHLDRWTPPPSRPAVVLDPFGGSGTTAMVARQLGRIGISVDMSADYCRLAEWRIFESGHWRKTSARERAQTVQEFDI